MKKSILLSIVLIMILCGVGCGKALEDYTVFDTENVKCVTFFVSDNNDGVIVPEEKLSEMVAWLGTFSVGEKTGETLIPGTQNDRVQIEYQNGDMVEGKLATITIDSVRYYLEYAEVPDFYFDLTKITTTESEQSQAAEVDLVETVEYQGKMFNRADLSADTLEWLEWYNSLSEEGQLSVSFVPNDLYKLLGYPTGEHTETVVETDHDNQNTTAPYIVNTYEVTDSELLNEYFANDKLVTMVEHYEMSDGTWRTDACVYQYRLEITGRMGGAVKDSTFVFLSNIEDISFDQAWKASGLSSNMNDYFKPEDAKFVGLK